jgi:hypothetical protein
VERTEAPYALEDGYDLLRLDLDYDGSCPCFMLTLDGTRLEGHCWRVCHRCKGCGIHYEGDEETALRAKTLLDAIDWYGEWEVRKGLRR